MDTDEDYWSGSSSFFSVDELPSVATDEDVSWLPYFSICVSIALLVVTLTVLTLLSFYGWKRKNIDMYSQSELLWQNF